MAPRKPASTAKTTSTRKRTTTKATTKTTTGTRGRKKTVSPVDQGIPLEGVSEAIAKFVEAGGEYTEVKPDLFMFRMDDRFVEISASDRENWVKENLLNIDEIYDSGDQKQWIKQTFTKSLEKRPVITEEDIQAVAGKTSDKQKNQTDIDDNPKTIAEKDAKAIIASVINSSNVFDNTSCKVDAWKNTELKKEEIIDYFDISPTSDDDMELCRLLSEKSISVSIITHASGNKGYFLS